MNKKYKNKIYSELMSKLKKSMSNEFYYEAIFIEYAILEDRTSSLLKHANRKYDNLTLNEKLSRIKSLSIFKDKYCLKHLTLDLIDRLYKWKNQRNKLIHDLIKSSYDNLDIISSEKSDLLCIASTGGVYPKRKLYTNDEESMMALKSNIILNGVNVVAIKPDLLDRCTLLTLERISEGERIEERILWSNFNEDKPKILGAILTTLSKAKRIYPTLKLTKLGRMADFTVWGYAVAEALEIGGEEFLKAYLNNQKKANQEAVESNPVATALIKYMDENKEFTGTVSTLLKILNQVAEAEQIDTKSKLWAKEPNVLSRRLNEMKSNLELEGIYYEITQRNHGRIIDIVKIPKEKVA